MLLDNMLTFDVFMFVGLVEKGQKNQQKSITQGTGRNSGISSLGSQG